MSTLNRTIVHSSVLSQTLFLTERKKIFWKKFFRWSSTRGYCTPKSAIFGQAPRFKRPQRKNICRRKLIYTSNDAPSCLLCSAHSYSGWKHHKHFLFIETWTTPLYCGFWKPPLYMWTVHLCYIGQNGPKNGWQWNVSMPAELVWESGKPSGYVKRRA